MTTIKQKALSIALPLALVASGVSLDRLLQPSSASATTASQSFLPPANVPQAAQFEPAANFIPAVAPLAVGAEQRFSNADEFRSGYREGFNDGLEAQANRNEGTVGTQPTAYRQRVRPVYYAAPYRPARRSRMGSKTRMALRIAAPAAIGAGIGALAGGGKGAGVGALIGGGSGAIYHLWKNRH